MLILMAFNVIPLGECSIYKGTFNIPFLLVA